MRTGPILIEREPHHIFFLGLRVRLRRIFGEAVGPDQATVFRLEPHAQCREDELRILVTGGPPVRGGGGMPQRIVTISVPVSVLRMTGAG